MKFIDNFPKGFTPRESQIEITSKIEDAINSGFKNILLCAPTGIGKSHIALTVARSLGTSFIVTAQKILQDQYSNDFKFVYPAKGKSNFPCLDLYDSTKIEYSMARKDPGISCMNGDCGGNAYSGGKIPCPLKPALAQFEKKHGGTEHEIIIEPDSQHCYYYVQKYQALLASHSVYNYASYFQTKLFSKGIEELMQRDCMIADEAHEIEEQIIGFIGHDILQKHLEDVDLRFNDFDVESIEGVIEMVGVISEQYSQANTSTVENYRTLNTFKKRREKFDKLHYDLKNKKENFVTQKHVNIFDGSHSLSVKPIDISTYTERFFNLSHQLFMSATINKEIFCQNMGFRESECEFIEIEKSPFPANNRKIIFHNTRKLNVKSTVQDYSAIYSKTKELLEQYSHLKGLILTTTKKHCKDIFNTHQDRVILAFESIDKTREDSLLQHKLSLEPSVLASPSFWYGVDLKDDLSRFQIILKCPYPSMADKRTRAKAEKYPIWYQYNALIKLLQGFGRSVRNQNDHAITHVLDESAYRLICKMKRYVPKAYYDVLGWELE